MLGTFLNLFLKDVHFFYKNKLYKNKFGSKKTKQQWFIFLLKMNDLNLFKVIFCEVIRCFIEVLLKSSMEVLYIPNIFNRREILTFGGIFAINRSECFIENKNKIRTFWGWEPSKKKNIELRCFLLQRVYIMSTCVF